MGSGLAKSIFNLPKVKFTSRLSENVGEVKIGYVLEVRESISKQDRARNAAHARSNRVVYQ